MKLIEKLVIDGGWLSELFRYLIAGVLVATCMIYLIRLWQGKIDILWRKVEDQGQVHILQVDKSNLEQQVEKLQQEKMELDQKLKEVRLEMMEKDKTIQELQKIFVELDEKYDDETYTTSQIMYTAEEIAAALANEENFHLKRDDIFTNLLDYLVNTIKGYREKNPRVVIHIEHPEKKDRLMHYAHSSGHSHRIREYEPLKDGSAAGRAWRTCTNYYVSDVEDKTYEYDRKVASSKYYRTILCVPLKAGNDPSTRIGVLSITGQPENAYEKIEIDRVVLFASLLYPLVYMDIKKGEVSIHGRT
jgi:hypothetical protein